jgi:DNA-directed RNA polymerase subunit RPC12/RpoP
MTCPNNKCGRVFDKPLELIDLAKPSEESSYVCPYCLSKLESTQPEQETITETFSDEKLQDVTEHKEGKCPQFVGYLSKRPKNVPIPDFCLTCPEMMKCLLG